MAQVLGYTTSTADRSPPLSPKRRQGRILRFFLESLFLVPAFLLYNLVRGTVSGRVDQAFTNADVVIDVERALGIFWELSLQSFVLEHDLLVRFFNGVYVWGHIPVVAAFAIWLFAFKRDVFARYRNAFLISGAIGLIFFITLPVAPPRFLTGVGFVDTVNPYDTAYKVLQSPAFVNQYAALPSFHFGWNLLVGIAVFQTSRLWFAKAAAVVVPSFMLGAIIFTANHYILDAVLGGAIALTGLWIAVLLHRRLQGTSVPAFLY